MEQLKVISDSNERPFSTDICRAVKFYMDNKEGLKPDNQEIWDNFIAKATKEELLDLSTFICGMNETITRKCQK
jgi:hypothetical protein